MKRMYERPEAELVLLTMAEEITVELGDISNPFAAAVAEDEAREEEERAAAK